MFRTGWPRLIYIYRTFLFQIPPVQVSTSTVYPHVTKVTSISNFLVQREVLRPFKDLPPPTTIQHFSGTTLTVDPRNSTPPTQGPFSDFPCPEDGRSGRGSETGVGIVDRPGKVGGQSPKTLPRTVNHSATQSCQTHSPTPPPSLGRPGTQSSPSLRRTFWEGIRSQDLGSHPPTPVSETRVANTWPPFPPLDVGHHRDRLPQPLRPTPHTSTLRS